MEKRSLAQYFAVIGPGIAVAATGVGAGDLVAATVLGAEFGVAVVWAAFVGAFLKFVLNEGLARWQLVTGKTILEGWMSHLGRWFSIVFSIYLVLWSFIVGGALISACGLAGHTIFPSLSVGAWGCIHSLIGVFLIQVGRYAWFERLMKVLVCGMFCAFIGCVIWIEPPLQLLEVVLSQMSIPEGSSALLLGTIGGVGGSLTLLSYGYWIRERGWRDKDKIKLVRIDLGVGYLLTGLFGVCLLVLAAKVLHTQGIAVKGSQGVTLMAETLRTYLGNIGYWVFVFGFWAAVATSLLGVWQSVPYLFCDFFALVKGVDGTTRREMLNPHSKPYRGYLAYLSLAPLSLLYFGKPVFVILVYSIVGALFMPFLAGTLMYMNSKKEWLGKHRNGWKTNAALGVTFVLFLALAVRKLI